MAKITRQSKVTFGKHKGRKLSLLDSGYLRWMVDKLGDSDMHAWAAAAREELDVRKKEKRQEETFADLEKEADRILRDAGVNPKKP